MEGTVFLLRRLELVLTSFLKLSRLHLINLIIPFIKEILGIIKGVGELILLPLKVAAIMAIHGIELSEGVLKVFARFFLLFFHIREGAVLNLIDGVGTRKKYEGWKKSKSFNRSKSSIPFTVEFSGWRSGG
jgi:hypothetical protein